MNLLSMKKHYIISILLSFFAFPSVAQKVDSLLNLSLEELMNVSVSVSSKSSQNLDESPGTVRVITRQQIADMNARTLKDVLNVFVPGLDAAPNSFKYDDRGEFFFSRGIYTDFSQQILILFNGTNKFSESTFGSPFVAMDFTLEMIERVEVSSTPAPVQGGSAITTFNIITRDKTMEGLEVQANAGFNAIDFYQSNKLSGVFGKTTESGWHIGSSFQVYSDKGQAHRLANGNGGFLGHPADLRDGIKNASNFTLNVKSPNKKFEIGSWYKIVNKDAFLSGLVPSQSSNPYNYQGKTLSNYISYAHSDNWTLTAGATNYFFENFYNFGGPTGYNNVNYDYYLESLHKHSINNHQFVFGGKVQFEGQSSSDAFIWDNSSFKIDPSLQVAPNAHRTILSGFAEDNWKISDKVVVTGGGRYDYYFSFGNTQFSPFNPRVAITVTPSSKLVLKALYASSFRPPAIYDALGRGIPPLVGQANIKPETVKTSEVSALYKIDNIRVKITGYYNLFEQGIVFEGVRPNDNQLYAINASTKSIFGGEFDFNYQPSSFFYLFVNASKIGYGKEVSPFLPSFFLNGGANFKADKFNFNLTSFYRGERAIPSTLVVNNVYASKAQFNTNLSISYTLKGLKFYTLAENLLDGNYYMPLSADGFLHPLRRRTINVGMVLSLN
jgi:outer membrane receptor for ferrienterochelin and colicins